MEKLYAIVSQMEEDIQKGCIGVDPLKYILAFEAMDPAQFGDARSSVAASVDMLYGLNEQVTEKLHDYRRRIVAGRLSLSRGLGVEPTPQFRDQEDYLNQRAQDLFLLSGEVAPLVKEKLEAIVGPYKQAA